MYEDILRTIGANYKVVNPYNEKVDCDIIIISKGYREKVKKLNPNAKIIEIKSSTFKDLISSLEELKKLKIGDNRKINSFINYIKKREQIIKNKLKYKNVKVNPIGSMIKKVVIDLGLEIDNEGILLAPDYLGGEIKTHRYDLSTLERIEDRYIQIINIINSKYFH